MCIQVIPSLSIGYAAHRGYLDRWKPSSQRCGAWESPNGPLHRLSRFRGYVLAGTLGQDAFIATNQSTIQAEREARQGLLSDHNRSAGASVHNGRGSSGGTLGGGGGKVGEQVCILVVHLLKNFRLYWI